MDEEHEMHVRRPVDGIPRRRARLEAIEHREETVARKGAAGIEGEGAAALEEDGARARPGTGIGDPGSGIRWFAVHGCGFAGSGLAASARISCGGSNFVDDGPLD